MHGMRDSIRQNPAHGVRDGIRQNSGVEQSGEAKVGALRMRVRQSQIMSIPSPDIAQSREASIASLRVFMRQNNTPSMYMRVVASGDLATVRLKHL